MPVHGINLLPKETGSDALVNKILKWALTFGRYTVILTEFVVVIAFLSRFALDQRLSDLFDSIKQKQLFIEANRQFETDFRSVQARLSSIRQSLSAQTGGSRIIESLAEITPQGVRFTNFSWAEGAVKVTAVADNELTLGQFIRNLRASQSWKEIIVSGVSSEAEKPGLEFTFSANWAERKEK